MLQKQRVGVLRESSFKVVEATEFAMELAQVDKLVGSQEDYPKRCQVKGLSFCEDVLSWR